MFADAFAIKVMKQVVSVRPCVCSYPFLEIAGRLSFCMCMIRDQLTGCM